MSENEYPAPIHKAFNRYFWEAIDESRLEIQECVDCGEKPYPPRLRCPRCFGELTWIEAEGKGVVHSFGVVHRPNQPGVFEDRIPIVVATIELKEGPVITSNLVDCDPEEIAIGDEVHVIFDEPAEGVTLPKFQLSFER
jgi:uncharacterized OB-fold protein